MTIGPGQTFGHYRLVEKIGEGGMGVVWKALDVNLDREVAIKVLTETFSDDRHELARFEREAKLLASINHPNVATVYGLHEHGGIRFLALELIPGDDLASRLGDRPLTVGRSIAIGRQIAAALSATHSRGVIHRDLKPANIYVTPGGEVKVLDFGIARPADPAGAGDSSDSLPGLPSRTQPGTILGTVSYMSPEQARGKPIDPRTDLWSFGCVLFRMLCGRNAFDGETRWDKLAAVLREDPDWSALPPDTPEPVRELLRDCLQKDRNRRPDSADDVCRVLDDALTRFSPTGEATTGQGPRVVDSPSDRRMRLGWAAVGVVALLAASIGLWRALGPGDGAASHDRRSIAVLPFESMGGDEASDSFTDGIHDDILNQLAKIGDLKVISRTSVMEYRGANRSIRKIGDELDVATVLEGAVQRAGQQVRINVQLIDTATEENLWAESYNRELSVDEIFDIQSDIAERIAGALKARLSADEKRRIDARPTSNLAAYDFYLRGVEYFNRPGQIGANLVASVRMYEAAIELDPSFALAYAGISRANRDQYWFGGGGDDLLEAAFTAAERAVELDPALPEAHLALGTCLYVMREYEEALVELNIAERGLPGNSELMRWKAYVGRRQSNWPSALVDLRRAHALNPRDAEAAYEVGFTLLCMRRYDESLEVLERSLALAPDYPAAQVYVSMIPVLRDGTPESAIAAGERLETVADLPWKFAHGWQTKIYARDFDGAIALVEPAERVVGQWHNYPTELLAGLARFLQGRHEDATRRLESARQTLEADLLVHPEDARLHAALGLTYAALGNKPAALASGRRAVELMPLEKDIFVGGWQLQDLAWICAMTRELDEAVAAFDKLLSVPAVISTEILLLDPRIEPLLDYPPFQRMLEKHRRAAREATVAAGRRDP